MDYTKKERNGWREIYEALRCRIADGELKPGDKLPSETQLVTDFGVSKMTVHRALRELAVNGLVRREERVGTFVAEVSRPVGRRIGLFLPATDGFLEIKYLSGIQEALGSDSQILIYCTDNDPVTEAEVLGQSLEGLDGVLILPSCHPKVSANLERILDAGCPVVCLDRIPVGSRFAGAASDNYAVTKRGLAFLEGRGHRRIAYFGFHSPHISSVADRYRAYADFVVEKRFGDPLETTRFIEPRSSGELGMELQQFRDAMSRLLAGPEPITAAFCANEHYLSVLLEVCDGMSPEFRERFEIVAFCDWPSLSQPNVRAHLIRQNARLIGRTAATLLLQAMASGSHVSGLREVPAAFDDGVDPLRLAAALPSSDDDFHPLADLGSN